MKDKECRDEETQKFKTTIAFKAYFSNAAQTEDLSSIHDTPKFEPLFDLEVPSEQIKDIFTGYLSDISDDQPPLSKSDESNHDDNPPAK
ncbi:hypothetical protein APHAL10511_003399 [Amanita phalloides]|nr:hypothetical protein APHAL10511_003399 [Amanita phalloides]